MFVDDMFKMYQNVTTKQNFSQPTGGATSPRKDDKLWQILSGLNDDAKVICFANTKRQKDFLENKQHVLCGTFQW